MLFKFLDLKRVLKGRRFQSDDEVQQAVRDFFKKQPKEFYTKGIEYLVERWDKCLNKYGDYF
jgi:hypothetical protein